MTMLYAARTAKDSRYADMLQAAGTGFNLLPVPSSTLGGRNPDALGALCLLQLLLRQGACLHFLAPGASCSSATRFCLYRSMFFASCQAERLIFDEKRCEYEACN